MRFKGAIHLHSTFSHDGTLRIAELRALYLSKSYQFIAITEHAEDLDEKGLDKLVGQCRDHSDVQFCVMPGIEFSCGDFHILGIGAMTCGRQANALAAIETIHSSGGVAILAHPKRCDWQCPAQMLQLLDAVEIWNVNYDGKFLPPAKALGGFEDMKGVNPGLLAVAGHDLHHRESFYDVSLEMDMPQLSAQKILENLRRGQYEIRSRFFSASSNAGISQARATCLRVISGQLRNLRRARSLGLEWFS